MELVVDYKRIDPSSGIEQVITYLFDPEDEHFYLNIKSEVGEEVNKLPHISNFVYPVIPKIDHLKTDEAKRISLFAMQKLTNKLSRKM